MQIRRRELIVGAGAAVAVPWMGSAFAQAYPARPVKIVVPWPAGGPADGILRPVCEKLGAATGQPWVLESDPGANGTIGTARVVKAAPDGYTLLQSHIGPMAISPALTKVPYDPIKGLAPITQLTSSPLAMVVRPEMPVRTVAEFMAYARAQPNPLNMGSVGNGSSTHNLAEMLRLATGLKYTHVPYKGSDPVIVDMIGGRIDFSFLNYAGVQSNVQAGRLRVIAVSSLTRGSALPDVPTIAETIPNVEFASWYGMHAPVGTPVAIINRIQAEIAKAMRLPDVAERLRLGNYEIEATTPDQFARRIQSDVTRLAKVVADTGMTVS